MVTKKIIKRDKSEETENQVKKIKARRTKKKIEKKIDEYLKEQSYLKESLEQLVEEEIYSRYKEELNLHYKNEISLMTKRIGFINKELVELRKLVKELKV
tara:strand:+ start:151 stop:450 length:300 start_codon:yes stop_codon:yes gene_type:complete